MCSNVSLDTYTLCNILFACIARHEYTNYLSYVQLVLVNFLALVHLVVLVTEDALPSYSISFCYLRAQKIFLLETAMK